MTWRPKRFASSPRVSVSMVKPKRPTLRTGASGDIFRWLTRIGDEPMSKTSKDVWKIRMVMHIEFASQVVDRVFFVVAEKSSMICGQWRFFAKPRRELTTDGGIMSRLVY